MNNLIIFDNSGNPIPRIERNGVFYSVLNIPKHSVKIPENVSIHIMEKLRDIDNKIKLIRPVLNDTISVSVDGLGYDLFTVKDDFISKAKNIEYSSTHNEDGSMSYPNSPMSVNLVHISEAEDIFEGTLEIFIGSDLAWSISMYTETEGEDERFSELLSNINEDLSSRHEVIFRDSDINEDLPSSMFMNDKRKELLTMVNDMLPYMTSVRGIKDVIDFFDYTGVVEVKEYWYDEERDSILIIPVDEIYKNRGLEKLSRFGLFYKLNDVTGSYDENGLPITKDTFNFSNNEILIKLFALKEYFIERSVGGISEIVDIIGEVYNFQLLSIRHWRTTSDVWSYDKSPSAKLSILDGDHYIDMIKPKIENTVESYVNIDEIGDMSIDSLKYHNFSHFKGYFNEKIRFNDDGSVKVGAPIKLSNETFDMAFGDINYSWDAMSFIDITWENAPHPNFYAIRYEIYRNIECVSNDGRTFSKKINGRLSDLANIEVVLPYDGYYDVSMTIIGYDNITTSVYLKKGIQVNKKDIDFMFFFKIMDKSLQSFENNEVSWGELNQEFDKVINYNNNLHSINDVVTPRYADIEYMNIGGGVMKQRFVDSDHMWKDYELVSFMDTAFNPTKLQKFVFSGNIDDTSLQVDGVTLKIPSININEYDQLADIFTMAFTKDFEYTKREVKGVNVIDCLATRYSHDADVFVGSSGDNIFHDEIMSEWGDFNHKFWECNVSFSNAKRVIKTSLVANSFSSSNVKSFYGSVDVPRIVPLFISIENNAIYGKKKADWKIYDEKGKLIINRKGTELAHMFSSEGKYTVALEIEDINGNKYQTRRHNAIKVVSAVNYLESYKYATR